MTPPHSEFRPHRVLVVDDDAGVRDFVAAALGDGEPEIEVVAASDGAQAWERLLADSFDLVLTDLSMPRMNGIELIDRLRRQRPDLPLLLMSGASADWLPQLSDRGLADLPLLTKPMAVVELREIVCALLGQPQPG